MAKQVLQCVDGGRHHGKFMSFCLSKIERYGYIDTMTYGSLSEATVFNKGEVLKKHLRSATRSKRFAIVDVNIFLTDERTKLLNALSANSPYGEDTFLPDFDCTIKELRDVTR